MSQSPFKLSEKTVVLYGQLSSVVQSVANQLTEVGADVALVTDEEGNASRFVNNLMDLREVHSDRGRAAVIPSTIESPEQAKDVISRAAELFGGVDILVDAPSPDPRMNFIDPETCNAMHNQFSAQLNRSLLLSHAMVQFLLGRNKGRLIYINHEGSRHALPQRGLNALQRSGLKDFVRHLALDLLDKQITVNLLALGLSEEFLLHQDAEAESLNQVHEQVRANLPHARRIDPLEVAQVVGFLASPLSSAITGQTIHLSRGD